MNVDTEAIIFEYYRRGSRLADTLLDHSRRVRDKAMAVAANVADLRPDLEFIAAAALLHDIGIIETAAPSIHCHGSQPYVCHGIIGRRMLESHQLGRLALVCERHIGIGITQGDIRLQQLPLPMRDMVPVSLEETIVCYADKFFSKTDGGCERTVDQVVAELARHGTDKADAFLTWHNRFDPRCESRGAADGLGAGRPPNARSVA